MLTTEVYLPEISLRMNDSPTEFDKFDAVDAADTTGCPLLNTDQRGLPRAEDGNQYDFSRCDIGFFELGVVPPSSAFCGGQLARILRSEGNDAELQGTYNGDAIHSLGAQIVDFSISGQRLANELDQLARRRRLPKTLSCDNGPELTCKAMFF
jgi:hypothetical protein